MNMISNLTISNENTTYNVTSCDTYTWYNYEYSQSGTYTFTTVCPLGCPFTDTLHLVLNETTYGLDTQSSCDSLT